MQLKHLKPGQFFMLARTKEKHQYISESDFKARHLVLHVNEQKETDLNGQCQVTLCE